MISLSQGVLGINLHVARNIDHDKQQITDLVLDGSLIARCHGLAHFGQFLVAFGQNELHIIPIKTDRSRKLLQFIGARQRGQGLRHAVKQGEGGLCLSAGSPTNCSLALFLRFYLPPEVFDLIGGQIARIPEHMRMAADHLFCDGLADISKGKQALFFGHTGMKDHLEQQISQFVTQIFRVTPIDSVDHLIGFLEGVGRYRFKVLCQIPGATRHRRPQSRHNVDQAINGA